MDDDDEKDEIIGELSLQLRKLQKKYGQLVKAQQSLNGIFHDQIVGNQSAWIEWKYGKGAKAGMQWIENMLWGPGMIPGPDESKYYKDAQLFWNEKNANPFPICPCGNPSAILSLGHGYCCIEHQEMHKEKLEDDAEKETDKIIKRLGGGENL